MGIFNLVVFAAGRVVGRRLVFVRGFGVLERGL